MASPFRRLAAIGLALAFCVPPALAQERFSIFVGSDPTNVERMLKLAQLRDDDVVTDLGSGDGRIVIGAARMNTKLTGFGVDVDEKLVKQATAAAQEQGVGERIRFVHQNAFDTDLSKVSVIFMWLWPEIQRMLRPKILAEARPGTRVVTNVWDLGATWQPDAVDTNGSPVSMWVVPAKVGGNWSWDLAVRGTSRSYSAIIEQHFQRAEGFVRVLNRRGVFEEVRIRGDEISIRLHMTIDGVGFARHELNGKVNGNVIEGTARIALSNPKERDKEEIVTLPWRAQRAERSTYFDPTGLSAAR